jgi:hypothetical protein
MSKPRADPSFGISLGDVLRLPKRHPAYRRREPQSGSFTERENLTGDAKRKGASGYNREAEIPMRRGGTDCFVVALKRGNARGAKEAGHRHWIGSTSNGRSPIISGRRQPSSDGMSRMNREVHVRICERLGVRFPGPTRHVRPEDFGYAPGCLGAIGPAGKSFAKERLIRGDFTQTKRECLQGLAPLRMIMLPRQRAAFA